MTRLAPWLLKRLFLLQSAHPAWIAAVCLALAAVSVFYTVRNLEFQTSQKDLISPRDRLVQLAQRVNQFEELDSFVVVMESPDPALSLRFLRELAPRLHADRANFREIFYRVDPAAFRRWSLLYLEEKDLRALAGRVEENREFIRELANSPTLVHFFEGINREMTSKMVGELFTGFLPPGGAPSEGPPLDLGPMIRVLREMNGALAGEKRFSSPWASFFTGSSWNESEEGYFWTREKRYLLLFVTPTKEHDFARTWHSLTALRGAIEKARAAVPGVTVGVTGPEALNADQMSTALEDMGLATLLSMGGIAALLMLFWHGLRRPVLEIVVLVVALSWSFGLTTLFIGHLNILSVTFAPLLLGLGIDYGAHWFARYREEEKRGTGSRKEAIGGITDRLGPGILLAGATAALSFFPLVLTGFKGLVELGIICSMGIALMTAATLVLLPALVFLFDRPHRVSSSRSAPLGPLFTLTRGRSLAILIAGCIALALSLWGAGNVGFDLNMLNLQSRGVESVVWEKKLLQSSELSSIYGASLASSLEEVRKKTHAFEKLPTVSRVESLDTVLPQNQEEKIAILGSLKAVFAGVESPPAGEQPVDLAGLERILGRVRFKMAEAGPEAGSPLAAQMKEAGELIDDFRKRAASLPEDRVQRELRSFQKDFAADLREKLGTLRESIAARPMKPQDLPASLRERFMAGDHEFLIRVFPRGNIWDPQVLGRFVADLRSVDGDAVGDPVTLWVFTRAFRDGCIRAAVFAVIFIFVFLALTFRDTRSTLLALVPLGAGTAWTLGLMGLFRVDLNLANSLFLPLVVGAAVEYAIIIVHRWRQREKDKEGVVLPYSTAMGVILAGLTTTVGFGSLCISHHRGIFSLGLLTTLGSLTILAAALLFLPALLQLKAEGSKRSPNTPAS